MKLDANGYPSEGYKHTLVVFNATNSSVTFSDIRLQGQPLYLHPAQQHSNDPATRQSSFNSKRGSATVPALTTAVFVSGVEENAELEENKISEVVRKTRY
jgi:hypothetical protein